MSYSKCEKHKCVLCDKQYDCDEEKTRWHGWDCWGQDGKCVSCLEIEHLDCELGLGHRMLPRGQVEHINAKHRVLDWLRSARGWAIATCHVVVDERLPKSEAYQNLREWVRRTRHWVFVVPNNHMALTYLETARAIYAEIDRVREDRKQRRKHGQ